MWGTAVCEDGALTPALEDRILGVELFPWTLSRLQLEETGEVAPPTSGVQRPCARGPWPIHLKRALTFCVTMLHLSCCPRGALHLLCAQPRSHYLVFWVMSALLATAFGPSGEGRTCSEKSQQSLLSVLLLRVSQWAFDAKTVTTSRFWELFPVHFIYFLETK